MAVVPLCENGPDALGANVTAVSVRGLGVDLASDIILRGVDFEVQAGSWFGLVGSNGSGKTTLLRCLAGRTTPACGQIILDGVDRSMDRKARSGFFGFSTEISRLPADLTAEELTTIVSMSRPSADEPAGLADVLEIDRLRRLPIGQMSSGMKQRVSIYLAFLGDPSAVILDEPFNWLDPVASYELKAVFRTWASSGRTLLTALHDIGTFSTHCSHGMVLSAGRVVRLYDCIGQTTAPAELEREVYEALRRRPPVSPIAPI